jgi:hypothetical protein
MRGKVTCWEFSAIALSDWGVVLPDRAWQPNGAISFRVGDLDTWGPEEF